MKEPASTDNNSAKLQPYLSPLAVWALSVGSAIGWGSLVVTSNTYLSQGGILGSIIGLLIGFVMMLMVANHYHFLANRYPGTGGLYNYVKYIFGYDRAYLPGIAMHGASKLFAGDAKTDERDALWESIPTSTRPDGLRIEAEGASVRLLAKRVSEAAAECARLDAAISSVTASRQGNKRLKNLLIFSCNSLARSDNRFGDFYRRCRDRGMPHGKALKAVARKRLKVIYAIMRDQVPYTA